MSSSWVRGVSALAAAAALLTGNAEAAAPLQKTQPPAYYRLMVGQFEVTVLLDGIFEMHPKEFLKGITAAHASDLLRRSFEGETVGASVNAFLVNTGARLVLIDTGCSALCGPGFGGVLTNLKAAGYKPEQVDEVYITHMHLDHFGGLTQDGKRAFPNAVLRVEQHDADYYLGQAEADKAAADKKDSFANAMKAVKPYADAGKFKPFSGNTELAAGIKAVAASGHTPGHTIYAVESGGTKLELWGDLMHVAAVQFPEPGVTWKNEADSRAATAHRKAAFAEAAKQGYLIAAAHLSFPGVGHLRADGKGYRFVPVDYARVP